MKAILVPTPGGPEVLSYENVLDPTPGTGEIVVKSLSIGVNNADLLQRRGLYPPPPGASPLLGLEIAGEVIATGPQVKRWKKGDHVMALLSGGGYAEKVAFHESLALPIPKNVSVEDAGAIPEVFLTAWLELVQLGKLKAGESVLIHAGASGVGTAAIQIAKALGAEVYVTAGSDEKIERCLQLGAKLGINYKTDNFAARILADTEGAGVHCILDLVGAAHWNGNIQALGIEGRLLLVGLSGGAKTDLDLGPILRKRIQIIGSTLRARPLEEKAALISDFSERAIPLFEKGLLKPIVDRVFPLNQANDAHSYLEKAQNFGKILLKPDV